MDGKPVDIGRVNYVLRAINMPKGKHEVVLDFHPKSVANTETVAYVAECLLLLVFIGGGVMEWRRRKKE